VRQWKRLSATVEEIECNSGRDASVGESERDSGGDFRNLSFAHYVLHFRNFFQSNLFHSRALCRSRMHARSESGRHNTRAISSTFSRSLTHSHSSAVCISEREISFLARSHTRTLQQEKEISQQKDASVCASERRGFFLLLMHFSAVTLGKRFLSLADACALSHTHTHTQEIARMHQQEKEISSLTRKHTRTLPL